MCVICACVCVWAWIIVWSVGSADGLLCLSVRLSDGMMIIIIIVDYTTQRTLYKYYVYALQYFISTSPFYFLYILYFFIFISDSLENIKNHWVQFKAHTQTYTYTHREKEMLIIFASFIIKQVLFMWMPKNCQANENEWLSFEGKKRIRLSANHGPSPFKLPSKCYTSFAKQLFLVRMRM